MHRTVRTGILVAGVCGFAVLGGCLTFNGQKPAGRAASLDQHVYESTAFEPKTVKLIDIRDQQELFTIEVPVGQKVILRFFDDRTDDPYMPAIMRWEAVSSRNAWTSLKHKVRVPPPDARRIEWEIRDVPELPPESGPPALEVGTDFGPVDGFDGSGSTTEPGLRRPEPIPTVDPFSGLLFTEDPGAAPKSVLDEPEAEPGVESGTESGVGVERPSEPPPVDLPPVDLPD